MISFIISIIIFALILGLLVIIHELGHFLAAKKAGIKVEEFGFGLPPKLKGIKKGETEYTINWLPMGGFVRLLGEDADKESKDPRSFANKPPRVKAAVILAGVGMNLVLAVAFYTVILAFSGFKTDFNLVIDQRFPFGHETKSVYVGQVAKGSPAESAGLQFADKVLKINNQSISSPEDLQKIIDQNKGKEIPFEVQNINTKETRNLTLTPRINPPVGEGPIGVALGTVATIEYSSIPEKILSGALHSVNVVVYSFNVTSSLISYSVQSGNIQPVAEGVSGPVGILGVVNTLVSSGDQGWKKIVELVPLISLSLAIFNVLPIPALDGGRLFFVVIELVTRKRVNPTVEKWIHSVGLLVLIALFLLVTYSDILKIFS